MCVYSRFYGNYSKAIMTEQSLKRNFAHHIIVLLAKDKVFQTARGGNVSNKRLKQRTRNKKHCCNNANSRSLKNSLLDCYNSVASHGTSETSGMISFHLQIRTRSCANYNIESLTQSGLTTIIH